MAIQTFSGIAFQLFEPRADLVHLDDITHSLSQLPRFTGHAKRRYYIAEHSYHVAMLVPRRYRREALLHDAGEAYVNDLSSPLKHGPGMEGYRSIEKGVERAIAERFKLRVTPEAKKAIKWADRQMLALEATVLLRQPLIREWSQLIEEVGTLPEIEIQCWSSQKARNYLTEACLEYGVF